MSLPNIKDVRLLPPCVTFFCDYGDGLAMRYDARQLGPSKASRQSMHKLLLIVRGAGASSPAVNLGEAGEIELEWWKGSKSLLISIRNSEMSFLRAWGQDPRSQMADGAFEVGDFASHWKWLQG